MAQRNRTCRGLSLSPLALGRWWLFGSAIVFSCYILSHSWEMSRQGAGKTCTQRLPPGGSCLRKQTEGACGRLYRRFAPGIDLHRTSRSLWYTPPIASIPFGTYYRLPPSSPLAMPPPSLREALPPVTPRGPSTSRIGSSPSEWHPPPLPGDIYTVSTDALPSFASRPGRLPSSASQWCGFFAAPR